MYSIIGEILRKPLSFRSFHYVSWYFARSQIGDMDKNVRYDQRRESNTLVSPVRTMATMKKSRKFIGLHDKDSMNHEENLIYVNSSKQYIYWCNLLLHPLSILGGCNSSYSVWKMYCDPTITDILTDECLTHLLIPFMAVFLLSNTRGLAHRMILRMYYNEKTGRFTAFTLDWLTVFQRKFIFTRADTLSRHGSKTLLTFRGNIIIKGKKFFLAHSDFRSPEYYNSLMGWDQVTDQMDDNFDHVNKIFGNKKN
ncbi:uncharacterized protein LOC141903570 [Tubulanus polymorphus]|uniref:uncharacterized protein LOC141903570 n=1 Tax=Tubulanus polymorphus TaxID=672921 RepID=UPI003DA33C2C